MKPKGFVRRTRQREVILEVLRGTKSHPTADWVYQEVRKEMPQVSLGTIYRNLKTLSEHGEIQELAFGSTHSRFDANKDMHYHFVCEQCGMIEDLDIPPVEGLDDQVEQLGFKVTSHRLEFYGSCPKCAEESMGKAN
ncbi:MAG TPA: transcriptional repressor [Firmicutes bacterium]|nr:transcriptional repressor [Bacillota bacterium]HHT43218.1 transcriptional repressor [Bacillota bacterium]